MTRTITLLVKKGTCLCQAAMIICRVTEVVPAARFTFVHSEVTRSGGHWSRHVRRTFQGKVSERNQINLKKSPTLLLSHLLLLLSIMNNILYNLV